MLRRACTSTLQCTSTITGATVSLTGNWSHAGGFWVCYCRRRDRWERGCGAGRHTPGGGEAVLRVRRRVGATNARPGGGRGAPRGGDVQCAGQKRSGTHCTTSLSSHSNLPVIAGVGVASISQHTFTVSIDGVEEGPPPPLPAPHHRVHFGEDGVMPASMGRPEYPTPVGSYTVLSKERSVIMDSSSVGIPVDDPDGYRLSVDYAVRITSRGLYVHSAPWALPALGLENVSHGCISLSREDAEWYYNAVDIGDPVIVQE